MRRLSMTFVPLAALLGAIWLSATPAGAAGLQGLVAPGAACPGQTADRATIPEQERAMLCLTNYARRASGLAGFRPSDELAASSGRKSGDIVRCDQFSHSACQRDFTFWIKRVGFIEQSCWRAGENIAWGTGSLGTVRSIFLAWMRSEGHRENILGSFRQVGIGLRVGSLEGHRGAHVWTQHFGAHC